MATPKSLKSVSRRARGSALATVILVILVLTIVGIGIAYFTQIEDRLSGNVRMQKAGFYAADAGLRKGESVLAGAINSSVALTSVLNYVSATTPNLKVPGGGFDAVILKAKDPDDGADKEFVNITIPAAAGIVDTTRFSLYVRNNAEDFGGSATSDTDNVINLISVGQVILPGGSATAMTQILEEQLVVTALGNEAGGMKGLNAGGTGSVLVQ